jgi:hypothetical protein
MDEMATGARCGGERQSIDRMRQLLQFADSVEMPRPHLMPVISGQPCALGDVLTEDDGSWVFQWPRKKPIGSGDDLETVASKIAEVLRPVAGEA